MPYFGSSGANSPWISLATLTARLGGGLTKAAGNPVVARGGGGTWDVSEVREMCPVVDEQGRIVTEGDGIWAYYGGDNGTTYKIGLAKSTDNGVTWTKYVSNPVVSPAGSGWYQSFIFQPAVVKQDSGTRVMLATGRTAGAVDSIGCLTSTDGLAWTDAGQKLTLASFNDGAATLTEMGVPTLIKTSAGTWLMLCEVLSNTATNAWRIYGATATDPTATWTPLNGGAPLFSPTGSGWENTGVANPHVIECTPGVYAMTYNGIGTVWQVGFASSSDLLTWTRYASNPILSKGAGGAWDNLETESGFLLKEPQSSSLRIFYNGFRSSDSTAAIGLAST